MSNDYQYICDQLITVEETVMNIDNKLTALILKLETALKDTEEKFAELRIANLKACRKIEPVPEFVPPTACART